MGAAIGTAADRPFAAPDQGVDQTAALQAGVARAARAGLAHEPNAAIGHAACAAAAYAFLNRSDPSPGTAPVLHGAPPSAALVARGAYLARAADCVACHTAPGGKPFAGGLAFKLPFGTLYSSNITPDRDTGIGAWSDDDFVRAMHDGIRKDGKRLYPAFPYTSYSQLSRDDALAIKAYLFSLPATRQATPEPDLAFPFNQRWAMGFWNAAFFRSARFAPVPFFSSPNFRRIRRCATGCSSPQWAHPIPVKSTALGARIR